MVTGPPSPQLMDSPAIMNVLREMPMPLTCVRCQKPGDPPPARRVPFPPAVKEKVLASVCASCWGEWEDMEVKVINEYRLNFLDPEHRAMLQRACLEFLNVPA
jgi:Fe-S cluster biosynthesis and repair protein YggX